MSIKYVGSENEIVFLNSGNIISDLAESSLETIYNGIPSHTLLTGVAYALSGRDDVISGEVQRLELSVSQISSQVRGASEEADSKFVHVSGDTIHHLYSENELSTKSFHLDDDFSSGNGILVDISRAKGIDIKSYHKPISISLEDSLNSLIINGKSLSAHIDDKVSRLSSSVESFADTEVLATLKQENGVVQITKKQLTYNDISGDIPQNKVTNLTTDYLLKSDFATTLCGDASMDFWRDSTLSLYFRGKNPTDPDSHNYLVLQNKRTFNEQVINVDKWIVDGMLSDVNVVDQHLQFDWNLDSGAKRISIPLSSLVKNTYRGADGILIDENLIVKPDYEKIASRGSVDTLTAYIDDLSSDVLPDLSDAISSIAVSDIKNLKFYGHLIDAIGTSYKSISSFFSVNNQLEVGNKVKNGYIGSVSISSDPNGIITTEDGLSVGDGDWVIVHDHRDEEYVRGDEFALADRFTKSGNIYVLKAGVSKYEYASLDNKLEEYKKAVRDTMSTTYQQISSIDLDSGYEACISVVSHIKDMISSLIEI